VIHRNSEGPGDMPVTLLCVSLYSCDCCENAKYNLSYDMSTLLFILAVWDLNDSFPVTPVSDTMAEEFMQKCWEGPQ